MKNTNSRGFIATSLIYSFLILFAGLVALILNNYTYYRTSLDNYNKNITIGFYTAETGFLFSFERIYAQYFDVNLILIM